MDATAVLFPGQGSHSAGMQEQFADSELLRIGLEQLDFDPFSRLADGTRFQQPALFLCSIAAFDLYGSPDAAAAAGHSLGEYAALVAAGSLAFEDALRLVELRGAAMERAGELHPGGMVALVGITPEGAGDLAARFDLTVANDNAPGQVVLSGHPDAVDRAAAAAPSVGARARLLDVSGAFHSPAMAPAAAELEESIARVKFTEPRFDVYSNGTALPFVDPRAELVENMLRPVRWRESILAMRSAGVERFLELGPGRVLRGLVKRTLAREAA